MNITNKEAEEIINKLNELGEKISYLQDMDRKIEKIINEIGETYLKVPPEFFTERHIIDHKIKAHVAEMNVQLKILNEIRSKCDHEWEDKYEHDIGPVRTCKKCGKMEMEI